MTRRILIDALPDGRQAAALWDDRLEDLLVEPSADDPTPQVGAIYRAIAGRPMKGQGGMMVSLGSGQSGFLRETKGVAPGSAVLVQVATSVEAGKAPPVSRRLLIKGHFLILTPDAPGRNIARSIRDEERRVELSDILAEALEGLDSRIGAILRSAAAFADDEAIRLEAAALCKITESLLGEAAGNAPELMLDAPDIETAALLNWAASPDIEIETDRGCFESIDAWSEMEALKQVNCSLGKAGWMAIEPTSAFTAIDVNTADNTGMGAGLAANLAAACDIPRQLRLRGLGGQIVIDFAPMGKKERPNVESTLKKALRVDGIETSLVGWTPLGHLELNRKRERRPLKDLL